MFSIRRADLFGTLTFRLTLWYAILFSAAALIVFGIMYVTITMSLTHRMDDFLVKKAAELEYHYRSHEIGTFREEIMRESASMGTNRIFLRLISPEGTVIDSSNMSYWNGIEPLRGHGGLPADTPVCETLRVPGHHTYARVISARIPDGNVLQIGASMHDDHEVMEVYRDVVVTAIALVLVCGGMVGWFMARRAMSGVERVTQTAMGIGRDDLVSRVPLENEGEEINDLARAFNDMLERLQGMVVEIKEVTNNIAHDLRSPITRIRGIAETTLTGEQDMEAYREMAGIVVEESDRLVSMINIMLDIAMTEAGVQVMSRDTVDMGALVGKACEIFQAIAEDKGVALNMVSREGGLPVKGDVPQLQRMIANLLDNAIKFTPTGGAVTVSTACEENRVMISVADTGAGIAEKDLPRVFDRFFRGDSSRSTPGNGLGLSHVKAIARAHDGEIDVTSRPGAGSTFIVKLPCMTHSRRTE